jgi:hypothetical protein
MRKILWFPILISILLLLSGCIEPSLDKLTITLNPGVDTIDLGETYQDPGATSLYGFIDVEVTIKSNNINIHEEGTYEIIYLATYKTISKEQKRIVTVIDQTPPVLMLNPGIDTVILGESWTDAYITITDNSGMNITVEVTGEVNTSLKGTYIITYRAFDQNENESIVYRYVEVIDLNDIEID